jgi:integrase
MSENAQAGEGERKRLSFPHEESKGSIVVKIYHTPRKKDGYDSYTVSYWHDGKRKREVLADPEEALARAQKLVKDLHKGKPRVAEMTTEQAEEYFGAWKLLEGTGVTLLTACREYAQILRAAKGRCPVAMVTEAANRGVFETPDKPVPVVVQEFLRAKREGRATRMKGSGKKVSEKYLYELERKLNAFAERFKEPIGYVTGKEINDWIHGLDVEGRTKNNYLQAVKVLFEFARKQHYVTRDCAVFDEVEAAAETDFEIEIFKPQEMRKLLRKCPAPLLPVLAIGAFAGLRTAEIERLDWSEVNLKTGFIEVKARKAKTRARRLVPITKNLADALRTIPERTGKVWPHSAPYLFELQRDAAKTAGVKWRHNALRHSFISYRLAMLQNVDQVALEAGNSPQMIFEHYRELVTPHQAKFWFALRPAKKPKDNKIVPLPFIAAEDSPESIRAARR